MKKGSLRLPFFMADFVLPFWRSLTLKSEQVHDTLQSV